MSDTFVYLPLLINLIVMDKYKLIKTLGIGAFGQVQLAEHSLTKQKFAIKILKQKYTSWDECLELREVKALLKIKNDNIILLKEVLHVETRLYLVFEYADTNLYEQFIKDTLKPRPSEETIKNIIRKVAEGLASMHRTGFFHRDLKPQNILYNPSQKSIKICDFGLARQVRSAPPYTEYVSTRWYRAPQLIIRMSIYNSPVDIFALGCIMAELYTGKPLFAGNSEIDQLTKVLKTLGTPNQADWPEFYKWAKSKNINIPEFEGQGLEKHVKLENSAAQDLLRSMLQVIPKNRITAQSILSHPYFEGIQNRPTDYQIKQLRRKNLRAKANGEMEHHHSTIRTQESEIFEVGYSSIKEPITKEAKDNNYLNDLSGKIQNQPNIQKDKTMELSAVIREIEAKKKLNKVPYRRDDPAESSKEVGSYKCMDNRNLNQEYFTGFQNQLEIKTSNHLKDFRGRKLLPSKEMLTSRKQAYSNSPSIESCKNLQFLKYKFVPKQLPQLILSPSDGNLIKKPTMLPLLTSRK